MQHGDQASTAMLVHGGQIGEEFEWRATGAEEPPVAIVDVERLVQAQQLAVVLGPDRANEQALPDRSCRATPAVVRCGIVRLDVLRLHVTTLRGLPVEEEVPKVPSIP